VEISEIIKMHVSNYSIITTIKFEKTSLLVLGYIMTAHSIYLLNFNKRIAFWMRQILATQSKKSFERNSKRIIKI